MESFTLLDVKEFIAYLEKKTIVNLKESVKYIPFIGTNLYQKSLLEQSKIMFFKTLLERAENGTEADKEKFIAEMTPILSEHQLKTNKKGKAK